MYEGKERDLRPQLGKYTVVYHEFGTALYFCYNFTKCSSISIKIILMCSLENFLVNDTILVCIFYKLFFAERNIIAVMVAQTTPGNRT